MPRCLPSRPVIAALQSNWGGASFLIWLALLLYTIRLWHQHGHC
ncbi:MAG: hypothetical protein P4M00_05510 [Azospirillaceae bacterium]|nr:hypothetical protein [Azospirillaceae bacterium]